MWPRRLVYRACRILLFAACHGRSKPRPHHHIAAVCMRSGALGSLAAIRGRRQPVLRWLDTRCAALAQGLVHRTIQARALELASGTVPNPGFEPEHRLVRVVNDHRVGFEVVGDPANPAAAPSPCRAVAGQGTDPDLVCGKRYLPEGIHIRDMVGAPTSLPAAINRLSVAGAKAPPWSSCLNFRNRSGGRLRLVLVPARRLPNWFQSQRRSGGACRLGGPLAQGAQHLTRPPGKNTPLSCRSCSNRTQSSRYPFESAAPPSRHPQPRSGRPGALPMPISKLFLPLLLSIHRTMVKGTCNVQGDFNLVVFHGLIEIGVQ